MIERAINLRIPGPTPLSDEVRKDMGKQVINHRGKEFGIILKSTVERLKSVFDTNDDIFLFTASGTGGVEAAIVNTLSRYDQVLGFTYGSFGDRFIEIAETFGVNVMENDTEWGKAVSPEDVAEELSYFPNAKAVLIVHNETSTAQTVRLDEISAVIRRHREEVNPDLLFLVDGISSLGITPFKSSQWGIDVAITGSQKGLRVPPALAIVTVSERAWWASQHNDIPRYYWDFKKAKQFLEKDSPQTPFTPAVLEINALNNELERMLEQGLNMVYARQIETADHVRAGLENMGFELFGDQETASVGLTAIHYEHADQAVEKLMKMGLDIAGGQGKLAGGILRFGHMGAFTKDEIDKALDIVEKTI